MKEASIQEAHEAFGRQVTHQVARVTGELNRLDGLLKAGQVDGQVLSEFRQAVDRVRSSGWQVQIWLEGDSRALAVILMEERIRQAARLLQQITAEVTAGAIDATRLSNLKEAMHKLDKLL